MAAEAASLGVVSGGHMSGELQRGREQLSKATEADEVVQR